MQIVTGIRACWGSKPEFSALPINNVPVGAVSVRRRVRHESYAKAFVKFPNRIEEWILSPDGDGLTLKVLRGTNAIDKQAF